LKKVLKTPSKAILVS